MFYSLRGMMLFPKSMIISHTSYGEERLLVPWELGFSYASEADLLLNLPPKNRQIINSVSYYWNHNRII